jgi:hypothetical protein
VVITIFVQFSLKNYLLDYTENKFIKTATDRPREPLKDSIACIEKKKKYFKIKVKFRLRLAI